MRYLAARFPITLVVLGMETALLLGGLGSPPAGLWRILAAPAYLVHLALFQLIPGWGVAYIPLLLVVAMTVDVLVNRRRGARH